MLNLEKFKIFVQNMTIMLFKLWHSLFIKIKQLFEYKIDINKWIIEWSLSESLIISTCYLYLIKNYLKKYCKIFGYNRLTEIKINKVLMIFVLLNVNKLKKKTYSLLNCLSKFLVLNGWKQSKIYAKVFIKMSF